MPPRRLQVALANRQDKVKGHHAAYIHLLAFDMHAPNCFTTVLTIDFPFTRNDLRQFQDST